MDDRSFVVVLADAQAGDPAAYRTLWSRYAGQVRGFLLARGTPEPDEVTNDVFLAAFAGLGGFVGGEAEFRGWIFGIARHKRADALRSLGRRRQRDARAAANGECEATPVDVEEEAVAALGDAELLKVLAGLTAEQRDVIVCRYLSDLSLEQTAVALGKSVGTVKALQHRAIARLRRQFVSPLGFDPYPCSLPAAKP
jgi:RNA polymerase sigma-70 factor (ECF subfamily)